MKRLLLRLLDSFFLLRPVVLVPVWGFALLGYYRATGFSPGDAVAAWTSPSPGPLLWIMLFSLSVGCVYVLNQIADIEADKQNGGLPLLASGIVSRAQAYSAAGCAAVLAIAVPAIAGHAALALLSVAAIAVGVLYSFKPTFFSGRPVADFLTNAVGFGIIAFGCGWHSAGRSLFDGAFLGASLPYVLLMCAGSISSTIPDVNGDRAAGKRTTAVHVGVQTAHVCALVAVVLAATSAFVVRDPFAAVSAVAALPLYLAYLVRPVPAVQEATYKIGGLFCMLAAASLSPLFVAAGLVTVAATLAYYRYRHGVLYPSLLPVPGTPASPGRTAA